MWRIHCSFADIGTDMADHGQRVNAHETSKPVIRISLSPDCHKMIT
jgi:hypothetical protein